MRAFVVVVALSAIAVTGLMAKKVKVENLPPAVQKTVKEQLKGATLVGLAEEVENGKTQYELETKVNGRGRDLIIDTAGGIVLIEDEMTLDTIPAAAKAAFEKQAAGGKITKVEKVTKGNVVTYEAVIAKGGKQTEVMVNADGSPAK
jgi:uncharacterized membrane protein YkoI